MRTPIEVTLIQWSEFLKDFENRIVAYDVCGNAFVSTVFVGLSYDHDKEGNPFLWETLVQDKFGEVHRVKYSSREAAEWGHYHLLLVHTNIPKDLIPLRGDT